jgi:hypothetical protein
VYFCGEGQDAVSAFTVSGMCDARTGAVYDVKEYVTTMVQWQWRGMVTPFVMAGRWGSDRSGGWWWIWPQEWSDW